MNNMDCPNCNTEIDTTDWFEDFDYDGDTFFIDCPHCKAEIHVRAVIGVDFEEVE